MNKLFYLVIAFLLIQVNETITASLRIVSLAPSITSIIYSLDSQKELVGCTSYCNVDKTLKTNVVASMVEINNEKILLLKPDVVLATSITKPSDIETLRRLGLKVTVFNTPKSYAEICKQYVEIGTLIGKKEKAQQIVVAEQARVAKLKNAAPKGSHPKIFFQIGAKPLFTVLSNTFMNDYITLAGGQNIAADLTQGTITRESVLLRNPDVIFIVTMGIVGPEEKKIWENYPNLTATRNKKIFIIDSDKACVATPANFTQTLQEIIKLTYSKSSK